MQQTKVPDDTAEVKPWPQVGLRLRRHVEAERGGKLFITTTAGHAGAFGLRVGHIVSVNYRIYRGVQALELLLKQSVRSYSFDDEAAVREDDSLPLTDEILSRLGVSPKRKSRRATRLTSSLITRRLESLLAEYVGIVAPLWVREVLKREQVLEKVILELGGKLPEGLEREAFVARARDELT